MKKLLLTFLIILFSLTSNVVYSYSADAQKGLDAARSGDYATALYEWKPLSEQGDEVAQYGMGYLYKHGYGVPKDYKTAFKWFTLAAEQGLAHAQNNLGLLYENGQGVSQDYKTAVKWYTLAAEQGFAPAQNNEKRIAAEQGLTHAQNNEKKIADAKKAGSGAKLYQIDNESMKHFFDSFGERRVYDYYENNDWERFKAIMDGSRTSTMGQGSSLSSFYNQYLKHDGNKAIAINTNRSPNAGQNYYKSTKLDGLCLSFGYGSSQEENEKGALDCCYMETQSEGGEKICALLFSGDRIVNKDYIELLHTDNLYQAKIKRNQEKEEKRIADAKKAEEEANKRHGPIAQQITQIAEGNYSSLLDGSFVKNPNNLPICQPSLQKIDFDSQVWDKCWGIQTWSGDMQSHMCVGNCPITRVFEGEYHDFTWNGLGINYYPESIWITIMKNGGWGKTAWGIEGWGFEQRSECKLLGSKVVDDAWVDSEKTDCPGIRELSAIFPTFDCTKSYPFKCDLNVSENFLTTPIGKEYVATSSASVREQPFNDSKLVTTIPKGTTVFVISKTETNDWYLIKEIRDNGFGEDIGQKLGYSPVEFFLSRDEITSNNNSTYSDSPGNLLINAYVSYMVIKNMHSMREGYAVVYINDSQMKKVKNQMIEIEKILVNEFSLDEDLLWDTAMSKYDQDYSILDLMRSTGIYTEDGNRVAMIALLGFDTIADEVLGSNSTKDF